MLLIKHIFSYSYSDREKQEIIDLFHSYDLMVGHNSQDGSLILPNLLRIARKKGVIIDQGADRETGNTLLQQYLKDYFPNCTEKVINQMKNMYLQNGDFTANFSKSNAETILTIYADLMYAAPALATLDTHCSGYGAGGKRGSTYMYRFDLETQKSQSTNPVW